MNLFAKIFDSSHNIRYIYDANGVKLASLVGSSSTYYRSVMTYAKNGASAEQLLQIGTQGGLIAREGSTYVYKYIKTDHLGSTRVVLAARSGQLQEEQRTDYYPYGLSHSLSNLHLNKFLFSGKELQDANIGSTGMLGLYDFSARYYNPFLGRWFNIDPALQFANPYIYCGNSPQMYIDPDGEWIHIVIGAAIGGIFNLVANWDNIEGFWDGFVTFNVGTLAGAAVAASGGSAAAAGAFSWGALGTAAGTSAVVGANNSIVAQTGKNFDGFIDIRWNDVGKSAVSSGVAGAAGYAAGGWAAGAKWLTVNGSSSPILRTAVIAPIGGATGHIAGGTAYGLLDGRNFESAFNDSFNGIGKSVLWSTTSSIIGVSASSLANKINPITGRSLPLTAKDFGLEATLDRIDRGDKFPHRNDGGIFENSGSLRGQGEPLLPQQPNGYYREYVHPTPGVYGPGLQRIVIGEGGDIWYTPNHYKTFIRIKR